MAPLPSVERFAKSAKDLYSDNRMVVFLCGPTLSDLSNSAATLRKRLLDELMQDGFEVVLGEDDGLEELRKKFTKGYAHDNELEFIKNECGAIVLVAGSVGSFCELGLFVHWVQNNHGCDLILLVDEQFKDDKSYFNEGPARAADDFGRTYYVDFGSFDISPILSRLRGRRSSYFNSGRGRPAGGV
ncbi:hypothetical protein [Pseudomonas sp. WS 5011]|uniref:hypothetical protein n=1 Tax=Pseudomonas sp. WS 5011 TaxID=2717477 RepID=UPI001475372E|nr:hypothetical protein [Pseudomonas sp. WS 5011]NMY53325.1 hypothetical protein [Pseudomonas sp. WS 5011]